MEVEINFTWCRECNSRDYIEIEPTRTKVSATTILGRAIEMGEMMPRIVAKGVRLDRYQPLKEFPDLYERFAQLQTQADVVKFIRTFGPLTEAGFPKGQGDNLVTALSSAKGMKAGNIYHGHIVSVLRLVEGPTRLQIEPPSLIDALWIQFAQDVSRGDARVCKQCGALFATGPDAKRKRRALFCSDECKIRFFSLKRSR